MTNPNLVFFFQLKFIIPLVAVLCFIAIALLPKLSGWSKLTAHFKTDCNTPKFQVTGKRFRFVSGSFLPNVFPVHYGSCLNLGVSDEGIHLRVQFPFNIKSAPVFVPWSEVEIVKEFKSFLSRRTVIRLRGNRGTITLYGSPGYYVRKIFAARSTAA
jgi:hypothetical protein